MTADLVSLAQQPVMVAGIRELVVPVLVGNAGERPAMRYVEFFSVTIRNPNTRAAYARACSQFLAWCDGHGLALPVIQPVHVAAWVEGLGQQLATPSVKQQLAAVRMLFDWLVVGQVVSTNPAAHVRGPSHVVSTGKTAMPANPVLQGYLDTYIEATGIVGERKGPLFRSGAKRSGQLTDKAMSRADVYRIIQRRAEAAGLDTKIGCHSWQARGIMPYLENGGLLEHAQQMAAHSSARTTKLYDRRGETVSAEEVGKTWL